jgi:hypothetical protein
MSNRRTQKPQRHGRWPTVLVVADNDPLLIAGSHDTQGPRRTTEQKMRNWRTISRRPAMAGKATLTTVLPQVLGTCSIVASSA